MNIFIRIIKFYYFIIYEYTLKCNISIYINKMMKLPTNNHTYIKYTLYIQLLINYIHTYLRI